MWIHVLVTYEPVALLQAFIHISRQSTEKAVVILILQSQGYRQQQALQMTWADAQNCQSQEDSDQVTLTCCAWDAPSSVTDSTEKESYAVTVITYAKDSCIPCPVDLLTSYICLCGITEQYKGLHHGLHAQKNPAKHHVFLQQGWAMTLLLPCSPWYPLSLCDLLCKVSQAGPKENEASMHTVSMNTDDNNWEYTRILYLLSV